MQKGGKLGFRLATGVKNPAPVSRFVFEIDSKQDAKTLFAHMMTIEGFQLIDPFHNDSLAKSRANPTETCVHCLTICNYLTVYEAAHLPRNCLGRHSRTKTWLVTPKHYHEFEWHS